MTAVTTVAVRMGSGIVGVVVGHVDLRSDAGT